MGLVVLDRNAVDNGKGSPVRAADCIEGVAIQHSIAAMLLLGVETDSHAGCLESEVACTCSGCWDQRLQKAACLDHEAINEHQEDEQQIITGFPAPELAHRPQELARSR